MNLFQSPYMAGLKQWQNNRDKPIPKLFTAMLLLASAKQSHLCNHQSFDNMRSLVIHHGTMVMVFGSSVVEETGSRMPGGLYATFYIVSCLSCHQRGIKAFRQVVH